MPDDKKAPAKPRYKVEEVSDEKEVVAPTEEKKITSFSMVDAPKPIEETKTEEGKAPTVDTEPAEDEDHEPAKEETPEVKETEALTEPVTNTLTTTTEEKSEEDDEIKKWLENVPSDTTGPSSKVSGGGKGKFVALFLGILIIAALGGGIYYYRANVEQGPATDMPAKEESQETKTEEPQETAAPTPTTVALDLSKYKVQILNGGGVAGEAGKAQGYLEAAGFKNFKTGNASAFTYTDTEVSMKKDTPEEVFTTIKETLEKQYQGVVKSDKNLPDSSEFDLQVVVGKKK